MREEEFVRKKFYQWYAANPPSAPEEVSSREFGIGSWSKKIESRHIALANEAELRAFLSREVPFFVSYSVARYEFPDARPMPKKNWKGADLVFDLDSDHVNTPCLEKHGKGWVCDACLEEIKRQAIKLLEDFLIPDFGLSKEEVAVNFSGNRGYHLHVQTRDALKLDNQARREIVDFIAGNGIEFESMFYVEQRSVKGPSRSDLGWKGKIARLFLERLKEKRLEHGGFQAKTAKKMYENEEKVVRHLERGDWDALSVPGKKQFWEEWAKAQCKGASVEIDAMVTADSTKLIRLPDSLHGETGLLAKRIKNLGSFDPLRHAVAFDERKTMRVNVARAPEFTLLGQTFGPFESQAADVPEAAAVYLLCKKAAALAE